MCAPRTCFCPVSCPRERHRSLPKSPHHVQGFSQRVPLSLSLLHLTHPQVWPAASQTAFKSTPPPHLSRCLLPRLMHSLFTGLRCPVGLARAFARGRQAALLPVLCPRGPECCGLAAAPATLASCSSLTTTKCLPASWSFAPADPLPGASVSPKEALLDPSNQMRFPSHHLSAVSSAALYTNIIKSSFG